MSSQFVIRGGLEFLFGFRKGPKNFYSIIERDELIKNFLKEAFNGLDFKNNKKQKFFSCGLISGFVDNIRDEKTKKIFLTKFDSMISNEQSNVFRRTFVEILERNIFYIPDFFPDFEKGQNQARDFIEHNFKY